MNFFSAIFGFGLGLIVFGMDKLWWLGALIAMVGLVLDMIFGKKKFAKGLNNGEKGKC